MAHFLRTLADWLTGTVPTEAHFDHLDDKTFKAINGDEGGTWNPTLPIQIAGAGLKLNGGAASPHQVTGAGSTFDVDAGAILRTKLGGGGRIQLADNDWVTFSSPRTREIVFGWDPSGAPPTGWGAYLTRLESSATGVHIFIPIPTHNGARLAAVILNYSILSSHFPEYKLGMSVMRVHRFTGTSEDLSTSAVHYAQGTDAASYYLGGAHADLTYLTNQNDTINSASYRYYAKIVEESGVGSASGNVLYSMYAQYEEIDDMRFP